MDLASVVVGVLEHRVAHLPLFQLASAQYDSQKNTIRQSGKYNKTVRTRVRPALHPRPFYYNHLDGPVESDQ